MRRKWLVGVGSTAVLAVAVLVVRPGSEVPGDAVTPMPSEAPSVLRGEPTGPARGPGTYSAATVSDFDVSSAGIGPLLRGQSQSDLAEAGWNFSPGARGCTRLTPAKVGEVVLSGWVVGGRLTSAQLEMANLDGRTSPTTMEFTFGRPVTEAVGFDQRLHAADESRPGGTEVLIGTQSRQGVDALISNLGTYGVRYAEVRSSAAPDCAVTPDDLGEAESPTSRAVGLDLVERLPPDTVGTTPDLIGTSAESLEAAGYVSHPGPQTTDCGELDVVSAAGTSLFLRAGVVVGQRYVADQAGKENDPTLAATATVGPFVAEAGTLVQRPRVHFDRPRASGLPTDPGQSGTYGYTAEVVPPLDTAVIVDGPWVLVEETGELCSGR